MNLLKNEGEIDGCLDIQMKSSFLLTCTLASASLYLYCPLGFFKYIYIATVR